MKITFPQPEGTLSLVTKQKPNRYRIVPLLSHSGSQWFHWCARIEDLPKDGEAVIELEWPRVPRAEDYPDATKEFIFRFTMQGSFVEALPWVAGISEDLESWEFPPSTREGDVLRLPLRGTGKPFYVTTQFPYTPAHLKKLFEVVHKKESAALKELGESKAGLPIQAVLLESPGGPKKPVIYMQAYQHMTEFSGPWVVDRMIRHLLSPGGRNLREKFSFHFVPVVDLDGLTYGLNWSKALGGTEIPSRKPPKNGNINRDWQDQEWVEVKVVDRFLRSQLEQGRRYCAAFDMHNGWIKAEDSGACYTVFTEKNGTEAERGNQIRFVDHLYNRTDHEPAGRYWYHDAVGTFTNYFHKLTGVSLCHTLEFSRSLWWNRKARAYEHYRPEHHERFAREMLEALAAWDFNR